jgi:hypothetical protein
MATIYGSNLLASHIGSSYLSRKHLKRAIKYGSYYGGLAAPVVASSEAPAATNVIHSGVYASRYHSKGGYHSAHHHLVHAPAPVALDKGGYQSRMHLYPKDHNHLYYGDSSIPHHRHHVVSDGASVHASVHASALPLHASYGSRRALKHAIKYASRSHYGAYYGGL